MGKSDKSTVVRKLEKQVKKLEKTVRGLEEQIEEYQAEAAKATKKAKKAVKAARRAADEEVAKAKAKARKRIDKVLAAAQGPRPEPHGDIPVVDADEDADTPGEDEKIAEVVVLLPSIAEQAVGTASTPADGPEPVGEAPPLGELESALVPNAAWTVTQLRAAARERGIVGYSRKSKAQLLIELA